MRKKIVVFTGAGVSRQSGLATFRDSDGLWANYRIEEVCTPEALATNRNRVIEFYNLRRREMLSKEPNAAHYALVELEKQYDVEVITQNVDNLHERAGSSKVTHLHGELTKLCCTRNNSLTVDIEGWEQSLDARHPETKELLRPFIVFFGEAVPMMDRAIEIASSADIFIVIGTSLQVYPAASLVQYIKPSVPVWLIDPNAPALHLPNNPLHIIEKDATLGVQELLEKQLTIDN